MAKEPAVSDAALTKILTGYAALVRPVLDNPLRWLGADDEPGADASLPARAIDAVKDRTVGETNPGSRSCDGSGAAEHGKIHAADWVPLLARVLFNRDLASQAAPVPPREESEHQLEDAAADTREPPSRMAELGQGAQRAVRTLWRLARTFLDIDDLLDERPRGGFLVRALAKVPVVGLAGGWLDERGAIRKAAKESQELLASPSA